MTVRWQDHIESAATLQRMTFPAVSYVVPGIIPEGLSLLAGKPKIGTRGCARSAWQLLAAGSVSATPSRRRATYCMRRWKTIRDASNGG